jgi:hypothetical protein
MQINNFNLPSNMLPDINLSTLQVGQRLLVEVKSIDYNQEGLISLNGKLISAKLEAQIQTGERFWAAVKEANEKGIVLIRENLNNPRINNLSKEQVFTLITRGFGLEPDISDYLAKFINNNSCLLSLITCENPLLNSLISRLWRNIPKWSEISGLRIDSIEKYYNVLGLNYERTIYESYKHKKGKQKSALLSIKYLILEIISNHRDSLTSEDKAIINQMLDEIIGQQLWIQTGNEKNAYCLMRFPLQDNGFIYNCIIAIESSRKGEKIDINHCHLALQMETQNIGIIGADLIIHENNINICILNDNVSGLGPIVRKFYEDLEKKFAHLGLTLQKFTLKTFEDYPQFSGFIMGKHMSGVDIKG